MMVQIVFALAIVAFAAAVWLCRDERKRSKRVNWRRFGPLAVVAAVLCLSSYSCTAQDMYHARLDLNLANDGTGRSNDPEVRATEDAADHFQLDPTKLEALASCESELTASARTRSSAGTAEGVFQLMDKYTAKRVADYSAANPDYPLPDDSALNPVTNARIAAWMIWLGGVGPWQCKPCYYRPDAAKPGGYLCHRDDWMARVFAF